MPATSLPLSTTVSNVVTEENTDDIIWLTHNNEPWPTVEAKWISVIGTRQEDIKNNTDTQSILKKWPLLKHSFGYTLVSCY